MSDRRRQNKSDGGAWDALADETAVGEGADRVSQELKVLARILIDAMKEHAECDEIS